MKIYNLTKFNVIKINVHFDSYSVPGNVIDIRISSTSLKKQNPHKDLLRQNLHEVRTNITLPVFQPIRFQHFYFKRKLESGKRIDFDFNWI